MAVIGCGLNDPNVMGYGLYDPNVIGYGYRLYDPNVIGYGFYDPNVIGYGLYDANVIGYGLYDPNVIGYGLYITLILCFIWSLRFWGILKKLEAARNSSTLWRTPPDGQKSFLDPIKVRNMMAF